MTKVIVIHPSLYVSQNDTKLLSSFSSDVLSIPYQKDMTKEQLFNAIPIISNITHIAFIYHYPGYTKFPFFQDSIRIFNKEEKIFKQSKYRYFSDSIIDIIQTLRDSREEGLTTQELIVDILSCDLNSNSYAKEVSTIETDLGINIRYSVDKTGNPSSGANWILESEDPAVNIRDTYFTEAILEWNGVLTGDIASAIKNGNYSEYISWNPSENTYTIQQDITWTDLGLNTTDFITLLGGEIFDGNGKTIDINGLNWDGLISISNDVNNIDDAPTVKNLGVINGTLSEGAGAIIRSEQFFFKVENCYSTGSIGTFAGGIAGSFSGRQGNCTIMNCYSLGNIGTEAGGITGASSGLQGNCIITNCYSFGIIGTGAGGIAGAVSGQQGNCTITNCYSLGNIGTEAGGITGVGSGLQGNCIITNCYSFGIIGTDAGGIAGSISGYEGNCSITRCVCNGSPLLSQGTLDVGFIITGSATISNSSTTISSIDGVVYVGWDDVTVWKVGGQVNPELPILIAFTESPWDDDFYEKANDPAQFLTTSPPTPPQPPEPLEPLEPLDKFIPCCQPLVPCNPNPQTTNTNHQYINYKLTGKTIATNVDTLYDRINRNEPTVLVKPPFSSYSEYMAYIQSKYR